MPYRRLTLRRPKHLALTATVILGVAALITAQLHPRTLTADPTSYRPLLDLIARVESKSNYNAYFGAPHNTEIRFTDMTIAEVLAWQTNHVQQGAASSAVGRYQIIDTTLRNLITTLQLDTNEKFDESTQDHLAIALLERRGSLAYLNKHLTSEQFAAELAKEWAALPRTLGTNPTQSYYSGDGLNSALIAPEEVISRIQHIRAK